MRLSISISILLGLLLGGYISCYGQNNAGRAIAPLVSSVSPADSLNADVLVYWKHDETTTVDPRVDSKDAQDLTSVSVDGVAGIINDGSWLQSGQYLHRADSATLSTGNIDFSFSFWILMNDKLADKYIIGKWNTGSANTREYLFYYHNGPDRFKWAVSDCTTFAEVTASTIGSPAISTWYYVVVWHDATNDLIGIQVNNGTEDTLSWTTGGCDTTTGFAIGALYSTGAGSSGSASSTIDETAFFKRLLTAPEKAYLYNSGAGKTCCPFTP